MQQLVVAFVGKEAARRKWLSRVAKRRGGRCFRCFQHCFRCPRSASSRPTLHTPPGCPLQPGDSQQDVEAALLSASELAAPRCRQEQLASTASWCLALFPPEARLLSGSCTHHGNTITQATCPPHTCTTQGPFSGTARLLVLDEPAAAAAGKPLLAGVALQPPPQLLADQGGSYAARRAALEALLLLFAGADAVVYIARAPKAGAGPEEGLQLLAGLVQQLRALQQARQLLLHQHPERAQGLVLGARRAPPALHLALVAAKGAAEARQLQTEAEKVFGASSSSGGGGGGGVGAAGAGSTSSRQLFAWGGAHACCTPGAGLTAVADAVGAAARLAASDHLDDPSGGSDEGIWGLGGGYGEEEIGQVLASVVAAQVNNHNGSSSSGSSTGHGGAWLRDSAGVAAAWQELQLLLNSGPPALAQPRPAAVDHAAGGRDGEEPEEAAGESSDSADSWGGAGLSDEDHASSDSAEGDGERGGRMRQQQQQRQRRPPKQQQRRHAGPRPPEQRQLQHAVVGAAELLSGFVDAAWFNSMRQCAAAAHLALRTYLTVR
jgi:hypothetical protein